MTTADLIAGGFFDRVEEAQKPAPKKCGAPVFIGDAVTAWGPETVLLKLLRDQTEGRPQDRPPFTQDTG